jgi:hypothetical protein
MIDPTLSYHGLEAATPPPQQQRQRQQSQRRAAAPATAPAASAALLERTPYPMVLARLKVRRRTEAAPL